MHDPSDKPHEFISEQVVFTGEQDGEAERRLKQALAESFRGSAVRRAYLARARIDGIATVALALNADSESEAVVRQASAVFASIFNAQAHLDVVFVDAAQESDLRRVCRAFYEVG